MAALTTKRARKESTIKLVELVLASPTKAYHNARVCFRGDGKVVPATEAIGLNPIGFVQCNPKEAIDAALGDKTVTVDLETERQCEWMPNAGGGDAVGATDIGNVVYMLDDQTVTKTPTNHSPAGVAWAIDSSKGVLVERISTPRTGLQVSALPAFAANDSVPTAIVHDAVYDVPATGAASTVTLPAAAPDGTRAFFHADGTKNGHTVQYRDATGSTNLTAALTASRRHLAVAVKLGGRWAVTVTVAP